MFRAGTPSSGPTTPTYAYEARKLVNTANYRNVTLSYHVWLTGQDGPATVNGVSATDRWIVRYSTVSSPAASDWIVAENVTTNTQRYHERWIENLPASSTLWLSFLADFRPQEPTNDNYEFNETAMLDDIVLTGELCESDSDCNDGIECTDDECNVGTGACTNAPQVAGYACHDRPITGGSADGYCDGAGACVQCVVAGHCFDDEDACTTAPTCTSGVCGGGAPVTCSDGLFCNGLETCDPMSGCVAGTPPTVSDGVACTADACNETIDQVTHIPNDEMCSDGMPCTDDQCSPTTGCSSAPIPGGICPGGGFCDGGDCVECLNDGQCPSGLSCVNNACECELLSCDDITVPCGIFADNGCGQVLDCTGICGEGFACDLSAGYEQGVCTEQCSDGARQANEEGRDCGGICPVPCVEQECGDGIDDDEDSFIDCADLDCVEAGACDRCAERRLGSVSWPEELAPSLIAMPASYDFHLRIDGCSTPLITLAPVELGQQLVYDFSELINVEYAPFVACLLDAWQHIDEGASVQPQVILRVEPVPAPVGAPFEVTANLRDLLAFDPERGQLEKLRIVVRHAGFDAMENRARISFSWEAIGYHDRTSDCLACTEVDENDPQLDFCTTQCRCDIGQGGCDSDAECRRGLVCEPRGIGFGVEMPGFSVCVPAYCADGVLNGDESEGSEEQIADCGSANCGTCPDCAAEPGCTPSCPCFAYEGPCTSDSECQEGLSCGENNGRRLGMPHLDRVCWPPECDSPSGCGTAACGPCDECAYVPVGCQDGGGERTERLRLGSSSMRSTRATFVNVMDLVEEVGPHALRTKQGTDQNILSLFEGAATNHALESSNLGLWDHSNVSRDPGDAPIVGTGTFGAIVTATYPIASMPPNQSLNRLITLSSAPNGPVTTSAWFRKPSGLALPGSIAIEHGASTLVRTFTPSNEWTRFDATATVTAAQLDAHLALNVWGMGPIESSTYDMSIALAQVEQGAFPTSWISTFGAPRTRELDRVVLSHQLTPPWLYEGTFTLEIEPIFGSADLANHAQTFVLLEYGARDQWLGLESDGEGAVALVAVTGPQRVALALPAFARNALHTITVSPATGELRSTLTSAVASGAPWQWPQHNVSVGARSSGTDPDSAYAWIGRPTANTIAPATCTTQMYGDHQPCGEGAAWCEGGQCVVSTLCGNGLLDDEGVQAPVEGCDDGNNLEGDGCSPECHPEPISFQPSDVVIHEPGVRVHGLGIDGADRMLLAWQATDGEGSKLVARRLTAGGLIVTDDLEPIEIEVGLPGAWPAEPQVVGLEAGGWAVLWATPSAASGASRIALRIIEVDGTIGNVSYVSAGAAPLTQVEVEPRVAQLDAGFVVAWVDTSTSGVDHRVLRARIFGAGGEPAPTVFEISDLSGADDVEPALAARGSAWAAVWTRASDNTLRVRRYGATGPLEPSRVIASHARSPSIAALPSDVAPNSYVIAWADVYDQRARALELEPAAITGAVRTVTDGAVPKPESFPVVGALGEDAFAVAFTYADGFRDSDFRVLARTGHLYTTTDHDEALRDLLMGTSNQRGVSVTAARNGLWFTWSDDGMPRESEPQSLPNGLRMYLLGCPGCEADSEQGCFNASEVLVPTDAVSIVGQENTGAAFGSDLAVDGDRMLVSAPMDAENGDETGAAWLYRRADGEWVREHVFRASDGAAETISSTQRGPQLGQDVALVKNYVLISAPFADSGGATDSGAAYLYQLVDGAWDETKLLSPDMPVASQHFGVKIAIDDEWMVIAADLAAAASASAALYVYRHDGSDYLFHQKITVTPPAAIVNVLDLELSDDMLFASVKYGASGSYEHRTFVYRLGTDLAWTQSQTLSGPDGAQFGHDIEADGDLAVISALNYFPIESAARGAVYVYWRESNTWAFDQIIDLDEDPYQARIGFDLALSEQHLAVVSSYAVHIFDRAEAGELWTHVGPIRHPAWTWTEERPFWAADFINGQLLASAIQEPGPGYEVPPGAVRIFSCSSVVACGDGLVTAGEECDDGNTVDEIFCVGGGSCRTCDATCQLFWPSCGNGVVQGPLELCDDGNDRTDYCPGSSPGCTVCTEACVMGPGTFCGDGIIDPTREECDDGNTEDEDGCNSDCDVVCVVESDVDSVCNGTDDDCDGELDEDYAEPSITCGLGACARVGMMECIEGTPESTCQPGAATGTDNDCDGINDDCDTSTDEDFSGPTTCGVGACARAGVATCTNGNPGNSCVPGTPSGTDATCNATDEDCDGPVDEGYVPTMSSCGVGGCARTGTTSCSAGTVSPNCTPGTPSGEICNFIDDDCDGTVDDSCIIDTLRLETGMVTVGATPVTVNFKQTYFSPVIVTTVQYQNNTLPVVTRLQAVGSTSFQIFLQVPAGQTPVAEKVHFFVVEEGVWDVGGFKIEAHKVMSTVTSRNGSFTGQPQTYGNTYTAPTVYGQVMSTNDPGFSVFWSSGPTFNSRPSPTALQVGLHVASDPDTTRVPETLGYIVLDQATTSGTFAGVRYQSILNYSISAWAAGVPTSGSYSPVFTRLPEIHIATVHAPSTTSASWLYAYRDPSVNGSSYYENADSSNHGSRAGSATGSTLVFEKSFVYPVSTCGNAMVEPGEACDDGNVITEYCAGGLSCAVCTKTCATGTGGFCGDAIRQSGEVCDDGNVASGDACSSNCQTASPRLETGTVAVGPSPVTVSLEHSYHVPVVVTSLEYLNNTNPVVVRVNNVTSTSFDVYLQSPTGLTLVPDNVTYFVVEQGVWNIGGFLVEAHRRTAVQSSFAGGNTGMTYWGGEQRPYGQAYTTPVVLGQVMSTNDSAFSVFWASAADINAPPDPSVLYIGQHTGDERALTRGKETLGYVVVEATMGSIGGVVAKGVIGPSFMSADSASARVARTTAIYPPNTPVETIFPYAPRAVLSGGGGISYHHGNWVYKSERGTPQGPASYADRSGHVSRVAVRRANTIAFQEDVYYPAPSCGNSIVEPGEDCDAGDTVLEYCPMGQSCTTCSPRCKSKPGGFCGDNILQAASGEVCDDGNVSSGDACSSNCTVATPRMEVGNALVGATPIVVELENDYIEPIVVTSIHYANNTLPVVTRIDEVTSDSFELRLQIPTGQTPVAELVTYGVVERGVWTIDGMSIEARSKVVAVPDHRNTDWIGYEAQYGRVYTNPVVLGQVMSSNNAAYSTFWTYGRYYTERPTPQSLWVGMSIGDDPNRSRVPETLGYWVIEDSGGTIGGVEYRTMRNHLGTHGVVSTSNPTRGQSYSTPFTHAPEAVLVTAGTAGVTGVWSYGYDYPMSSRSMVHPSADNPAFTVPRGSANASQIAAFATPFVYPAPTCGNETVEPGEECDEGDAITEHCSAGVSCSVCDAKCRYSEGGHCGDGTLQASEGEVCDDGNSSDGDGCSSDCDVATPKLEVGEVSVGGTAVTVNLVHDYASPVVVATIQYANNTVPVVTRINNVTTGSFDIRLQNPQALSVVADNVSYIVVEEGVWEIDGRAIEAQRRMTHVTSGEMNGFLHWVPERAAYGQAYTNPVVLGQVMSMNDARFSVFWSSNGLFASGAPSSTHLYVGKHVGEDPAQDRADEEIGFIVMEAGAGTIGGIAYRSAVPLSPSIPLVGNTTGVPANVTFSSAFSSAPAVAIVTQTAGANSNGTWNYLYGSQGPTATTIPIAGDRTGHVARTGSGRAAYVAFHQTFAYPTPP